MLSPSHKSPTDGLLSRSLRFQVPATRSVDEKEQRQMTGSQHTNPLITWSLADGEDSTSVFHYVCEDRHTCTSAASIIYYDLTVSLKRNSQHQVHQPKDTAFQMELDTFQAVIWNLLQLDQSIGKAPEFNRPSILSPRIPKQLPKN